MGHLSTHSQWLEQHRTMVWLVFAALTSLCLVGLSRLQFDSDHRVYFDADDALSLADRSVAERFALSDSAILVVRAGDDDLFSDQMLAAFGRLERDLLALPFVTGVRGAYQLFGSGVQAGKDDPFAETPGSYGAAESPPRLSELEQRWKGVRQHPRASLLVSGDGGSALLEVQVNYSGGDAAAQRLRAMPEISALAQRHLIQPGHAAAISYGGVAGLNQAYIDVVRHDLKVFFPGLLLSMALVLVAVFRSILLVAILLGGGLVVAMLALGAAGWAGWPLAAINAFTPVILISLHLAAAMHLVVAYLLRRAEGFSSGEAIVYSLAFNRRPMLLSAATTGAGFLLLAFSPSPPIRVMGFTVALGTGVSLLFNLSLLPLLLTRVELSAASIDRFSRLFDGRALVSWVQPRATVIVALAAGLAITAAFTLVDARVDDSAYSYFPEGHTFSDSVARLDRDFSGSVRLSYALRGRQGQSPFSQDYADAQQAFRSWLLEQEEVRAVREVYQLMEAAGLDLDAAQALLTDTVREIPGLAEEVDANRMQTRVEVMLGSLSSLELLAFDQRARDWLSLHGAALKGDGGTGPDLVFAVLGQRNAASMFAALGLALALIGLLLGVLFRDIRMALWGLLCNVLPLVFVYSAWFGSGGFITLGAAVVLGMILGIIVDDTLHLLCKYRALALDSPADAVAQLGRRVLPAVAVTSVTLCIGLTLALFSDFRPLRELGGISVAVIFVALLVDAILLPALLILGGRQR